ncbi:MAG: NTP transferase domain-containing protein [Planctomycetota bacterium]
MTATSPEPRLVILAAGASTRLGQPKALVPIDGQNALQRYCAVARELLNEGPIVVTGAHHAEIAAQAPAGAQLVHNALWQDGRTGSLQCAWRAAPGRDLLVAPADVPRVPIDVFALLLAAWHAAANPAMGWLAPFWAGPDPTSGYGHPVCIGRSLAAQLEDFSSDTPLRALRTAARPLWQVAVRHPEILEDLDTPADLDALSKPPPEAL